MRGTVFIVAAFVLSASIAWADRHTVEFDVAATVAVQEIAATDITFASADEKLIAIHLQVSTYVSPGNRTPIDNVVLSFDSSSNNFQVMDFFPKTMLDTRYAGPVAMQDTNDRRLAIDFDATGLYKAITGASLTGSFHDTHYQNAEYKLLPPKEVVAASGTIERGRGVYFKFKPSVNETIEGAKELLIVARVPVAWRGDLARLRCTADGESLGTFASFEHSSPAVKQDFLLGLHLEGDLQAKQLAEQFVASEQWLRRVAREAEGRNGGPRMLQSLGLSKAPPNANAWLNDWIYGGARKEVADRLPEAVRRAAWGYAGARTELHRLSGIATPRVAARATIAD